MFPLAGNQSNNNSRQAGPQQFNNNRQPNSGQQLGKPNEV